MTYLTKFEQIAAKEEERRDFNSESIAELQSDWGNFGAGEKGLVQDYKNKREEEGEEREEEGGEHVGSPPSFTSLSREEHLLIFYRTWKTSTGSTSGTRIRIRSRVLRTNNAYGGCRQEGQGQHPRERSEGPDERVGRLPSSLFREIRLSSWWREDLEE